MDNLLYFVIGVGVGTYYAESIRKTVPALKREESDPLPLEPEPELSSGEDR